MNWKTTSPHAEKLFEILKNAEDIELRIPLEKLSLDHRLREDLGLDSIQTVSILYELEESYPHLTESALSGWKTIGDILKSMSEEK